MLNSEIAAAFAEDAKTLVLLQNQEISPAVIAELRGLGFPDNLAMLPAGDASQNSFDLMRRAISALDGVDLDFLAADFAAIYLTGAYGASPNESFWLSDDHLICQDAMFELRALYAEHGLAAPNWRIRPDDHLIFQLEFLAHCLAKASDNEDWRAIAHFLDYHLLRWLPDFAVRIVDRCDTMFYGALIILVNSWCQQLRDLIASDLDESRPSREEIEDSLRSRQQNVVKEEPLHFMPGMHGPSW